MGVSFTFQINTILEINFLPSASELGFPENLAATLFFDSSKILYFLGVSVFTPPQKQPVRKISDFDFLDSLRIVFYGQLSVAEQLGILCSTLKYFLTALLGPKHRTFDEKLAIFYHNDDHFGSYQRSLWSMGHKIR